MKRFFLLPLACVMLFAMAGCDSHEKVAEDSLKTMEDFVAVLKTIKDEDTAKAAVPDLEAIAERMEKIKERLDSLGDPSEELDAELKKKHEERLAEVMGELLSEVFRVAMLGEEVQKILDDAMESMPDMDDDE